MVLSKLFDKSRQLTYDRLVQVRSFLFSLLGLIGTIVAICIDLYLHLYIIGLLVGGMIVSLCLAIWFCLSGRHELFKLVILLVINGLLLILSFAEGGNAYVFIFYFPVILVMPFILPDNKKYNLELFIYAVTTAAFACISILATPDTSLWENISAYSTEVLRNINSILSLLITLSITLSIIYSEKYFKDLLYRQKNKAEQSNLLKGRFLSGTSHELRTSLNGITGTTHLLEMDEHLPAQQKHFSVLKYCSAHMLNIVNEILDLDKIESGMFELHPRVFNLTDLLMEVQNPFTQKLLEKKLQFKVHINAALSNTYLFADDVRLLQVINNLLSSAIKFTNTGTIILEVDSVDQKNTKITLRFSVEDTGIGIEPEFREKIFDNFWQVYNEKNAVNRGTGLGLALTKRILELMNSKIEVESTPGAGSKFSFLLETEIADAPKRSVDVTNNDGLLLIKNKKILIAEDDIVSMTIAQKLLEANNAVIFKAENGEEAMIIFKGNPEIDLILLDLEMPLMNGYDTIKEIRKISSYIPVVAFTAALLDKQTEQSLITQGFTACISKPFDVNAFSKVFTEVFGK